MKSIGKNLDFIKKNKVRNTRKMKKVAKNGTWSRMIHKWWIRYWFKSKTIDKAGE